MTIFPLNKKGTTYSVARMNPCCGLVESGSTVNLESETSNVTSAFSPKSLSITDTEGKKNDLWLLVYSRTFRLLSFPTQANNLTFCGQKFLLN